MNIKILGTRGEIEESAAYHSHRSGVLIDNKILLDCGEKEFLSYHPSSVLLTHLHPDHAYFVRHHEEVPANISFYAPEPYDKATIHQTDRPFMVETYTIIPIPTVHSITVQSNAYIVEHAGKRLLYTGDMIWINKEYHSIIGQVDLVITEASHMRVGGLVRSKKGVGIYGHTGVPNLVQLLKQFSSTILFVHFGAWFYHDIAQARHQFAALAQENNVQIIVGYDGLELTI
ncbi:MBL fold metallo-hydrolase [Candidatus Dependentiae bacterium]|nr:MBL fold metallo-hydrolase [Candidatus Dependentiae bacterium]